MALFGLPGGFIICQGVFPFFPSSWSRVDKRAVLRWLVFHFALLLICYFQGRTRPLSGLLLRSVRRDCGVWSSLLWVMVAWVPRGTFTMLV